jgi:hypothetical protein
MRFHRFSCGAFALVSVVASGSAFAKTCTLASVSGVYGLFNTGTDGTGQPYASAGQLTADGKGGLTFNSITTSHNGTISTNTGTGTYTVAKNCTGTVTVSPPGSGTANIYGDTSDKGWQTIDTGSGTTGHLHVGFATPQGTVTCGLTGKAQTFAINVSGTLIGTGAVNYTGQARIDGKGKVAGNILTLNLNGTIDANVPITGTYTEASTCLGTMTITPSGLTPLNFNTVVVNAGKEWLLIETDNNTAVNGTMQ